MLERSQGRPVTLRDRRTQILLYGFLFNQDMGGPDVSVDETGVGKFHPVLEGDYAERIIDLKNLLKQLDPERLGFTFLITSSFPFCGKILSRFLLR